MGAMACSLLLSATLLAPSAAMAGESARLVEIAQAFGFQASQLDALRGGETIAGQLEARSGNELALSMALLSSRDLAWHWDELGAEETSDPTVHATGELVGDGRASLEKLELPVAELDRLADVEPGEDANFSSEEYARLASAQAGITDQNERRAALQATLREILAERLAAYRSRGLAGIAPYQRADGEESPAAAQLERAFGALKVTRQVVPAAYRAMAEFPKPVPEGVESRFYWIVHEAQDRLAVALAHVVYGRAGDAIAYIERRFYVSHSLNSLQAVALVLPIEEGTAVFYANRTGTDQVTGFGSSVAKEIGRRIMRGELERLGEAYLESSNPG